MGIGLSSGASPYELQDLARRALIGDKQAQLELGIAFEEGRGIPVDHRRARRLYSLAASETGGSAWVWSAPVGLSAGRLIRIDLGQRHHGLSQATTRLKKLAIVHKESKSGY
jgi:TPR repeat protein